MLHCIVYLIVQKEKEEKKTKKNSEKKKMKTSNKNCSEFAMSVNWGRISAGAPDPILDSPGSTH